MKILNHEIPNTRVIVKEEDGHKKYKKFKFGFGHAYKHSDD
jgi:hypothetical protein